MNPLTSAARRALRAKAHALNPVVAIGQHGLTPAVLHEIDVALLAHELIKIRVFSDDRAERELLYARICAELDAAPVQHIGKLLVVWRLAPEPEPEPLAARPAPRKTVKGAKPGTRAPRGQAKPDARVSRGQAKADTRPPRGHAKPDARTPRGKSTADPRAPRGTSTRDATTAGGRRRDPYAAPAGVAARRTRGAPQDRTASATAASRPPRRRRAP